MKILVTGGCGFIGSNYLNVMIKKYPNDYFICLDKLTYAGNVNNLDILDEPNFKLVIGDICDEVIVSKILNEGIDLIINFAAETHVDNSIINPKTFYKSNIFGVINLLELCKKYKVKRFHQVSTDEVYGDLPLDSNYSFKENDPLKPSSPYSSSKASAELITLAYYRTYGLDVTITRSVNNFGPHQNKEKFIPKIIDCIEKNQEIPVYGNGLNIRSWINVNKNNFYIDLISRYANSGEVYNISDNLELTNLEVIDKVSKYLKKTYRIKFTKDRLGHDLKMSIDNTKLKRFVQAIEEGLI
ncbi:MAG: GDP-mannose 4,6-dehydratase [Firmicutes bacterium]|uniref:GDP-mannose 4,6-dehydratase n=1 Tax=Candidatus Onthovivens merdipullorum TaxID=2840889 RepID=A0A9D9DJT1_9BACL|nr:GDP-mannose 4,6-dehydratase [Candidatus Onthovivens merdipullorum]